MKRYLITGFLLLVPLYGISKATAELVNSMGPQVESPMVTQNQVIAEATPQLMKAAE